MLMALALSTGGVACGGDDDDDTGSADRTTSDEGAPESSAPSTTGTPTTSDSSGTQDSSVATETSDSTSSSTTSDGTTLAQDDDCNPFGTVVTVTLNDRCSSEPDRVPPPEELGTAFVSSQMAWNWQVNSCQGLVAVPDQIIVTVSNPDNLATEAEAVRAAVGGSIDTDPIASDAQIITLPAGGAIDAMLNQLPTLQGIGRSVDLNYLEPVLPNNVFRPNDDPHPVGSDLIDDFLNPDFTTEELDVAGDHTIAVVDSTADLTLYDLNGNGFVDEDHGHGAFVTSIAQRSGANVNLQAVVPNSVRTDNPSVLISGRWAPMMIEDADIIQALDEITLDFQAGNGSVPSIVNMSLGGVGCPAGDTGFDWGIGERIALARKMDNVRDAAQKLEVALKFVAAAGNNGADVLHFPAAWRNDDVTVAYEPFVPSAVHDDIKEMHLRLIDAIFAVGSVDSQGTRDVFSNCGKWVNAAAFGANQVGVYPAAQPGAFAAPANPNAQPDPLLDYASWSGTSFATANFAATLATGFFDTGTLEPHPDTGARLLPEGLACA